MRALLSSARTHSFWLVTLLLMTAIAGMGQERFGELHGVATDPSGAVLPNVVVTMTEKDTDRSQTTKTDGAGAYVFRSLEPGNYTVTFEVSGFSKYQVPNVVVQAGRVLKVDAQMAVGSTEQAIQVTESAPLIDVTTTAVATNINSAEFNRLPKSRTFQSLAVLAPTANEGTVEGGFQINGASGAENNFIVDGMSTSSLIQGNSRQNAAFEILQEVQIKTAGIEAQYGGALGGVISAITKSGGNNFHGDVHYYYWGSKLNAGAPKRLFMDPSDLLTTTYQQDFKFPQTNNEVGYSLGGPFIKNKLYFFSAASPRFLDRNLDIISSDNQTVNITEEQTFWQAYNKISYDPFQSLRINAAFLWSPTSREGILPAFTGYGNRSTSNAASLMANQTRGTFSPQSNYNGQVDWTVTPTTLLTVRGGRFYDNYKALGVPGVSAIEWGNSSTASANLPFPLAPDLQRAQGSVTTPRVRNTEFDLATRTLGQVDASHFANFFGGHDFKVGFGRMKNVNKVQEGYPGGGYITLNWNTAFTNPVSNLPERGTYGYYTLDTQGTRGSTGGTIDNFYIQDRWRIGRLSLDLGLRLEKEVVPSFRRDIKEYAFEFGWGEKIAPRLGATYDVFGDGKLKVYGSWGMFFDWVKYELARGTFGGDVWTTAYRSLDSTDPAYVLGLSGTNLPGRNLWPGGGVKDSRIPSFGADQVDPDLRPMHSDLTNAGVEFQLNPRTVLSVRYTRNNLRDTIEDLGVLDANGSEVYIYGNPGRGLAKTVAVPSTATPKFDYPLPERTYNGLDFTLSRRFAERWMGSATYVYSRLRGNYGGLANSDEIFPAGTGRVSASAQQVSGTPTRPGTSAGRAWDLDTYLFDSKGNLNVTGPLGTDRPHSFKAYGSYFAPFGTEIGGFFIAQSGVPVSTWVQDTHQIPLFVNGRGDMGRSPVYNRTDLVIAQEFKVGEGKSLRFEFNAENVFNQKTAEYVYNFYNRFRQAGSLINLNTTNLNNGYNYEALVAASPDALRSYGAKDPRFGMEDNFRTGFAGRLGVKFTF
ncbi:MAG TPA: TonB-dependent receptor [Bryobacteraceae bacterium]|nr:TonB-dependent receptor [Bryobacteraceae bacterium]